MDGLSLDNMTVNDDNIENLMYQGDVKSIEGLDDTVIDNEEKEKEEEQENPIEVNLGLNLDANLSEEVDKGENQVENPEENTGASSPNNLYSSIARDLLEAGVLTLDEKLIEGITSPGDLAEVFKQQVDSLLDETQQRINEALNNQIPPDTVKQYEGTINSLKAITNDQISDESVEGEEMRKQLIYSDYINKGFSKERAEKEVKKSFDGGNDIEDAQDALNSLIDTYDKEYKDILKEAKEKESERIKAEKEQLVKLKSKFLDNEEPIKGMKLSKAEREKMYAKATSFIAKDNYNRPLTELMKYSIDNPIDYQYYINMLFYQTNGFKDLSSVVSKEVKEQKKIAMKHLERTIKSQGNTVDSGLEFGNSTDPESFSSLGLKLNF